MSHHIVYTEDPPQDTLAPEGRAFYVSVVNDAGQYVLAAGPFQRFSDAERCVAAVRERTERLDPRGVWYAYGTAQADTGMTVAFPDVL